jgi:acetyltransferase-like isoleucine patch superfamily enzyme
MEKQPPNRMPQYTDDWLQTYRNQGVDATAGRYTYGRPEIQFRPAEIKVTQLCIGAFCSIARGCTFNLGSFGQHPLELVSTYPLAMILGMPTGTGWAPDRATPGSIEIGSDVWIGEGSIIFSGVTIGHGAVIGTRSLVNRDVPPYAVVAGTPARVIRLRFPEDVVERLLALCWWDWGDAELRARLPAFFMRDIYKALEFMERRVDGQDLQSEP